MKDHERSDWNLSYVVWGFVVLAVLTTAILAASWLIFAQLRSTAANRQVEGTRLSDKERIPPEPRLQIAPDADWEEMLMREQEILKSYRWIDRSQGVVHIPIERAMELVAEGKR